MTGLNILPRVLQRAPHGDWNYPSFGMPAMEKSGLNNGH
jgi:hypothetical protein